MNPKYHYRMSVLLRNILSRYLPAVTLPVAAVIGFIGYHIESRFSKNFNTPYLGSVQDKRDDRLIDELNNDSFQTIDHISLKKKEFVPKTVFEKNVSPSLAE